jgi:hypothetical protein
VLARAPDRWSRCCFGGSSGGLLRRLRLRCRRKRRRSGADPGARSQICCHHRAPAEPRRGTIPTEL